MFIGRNTILSCKNGDIEIADGANIGFNCEIFSASRVTVGADTLVAAYAYLVGGDHDVRSIATRPVIEQGRRSAGIDVGDGAWIGAGATILDGVTVGDRAVVGAGAVVRESDVPAGRHGRRRAGARGLASRATGARLTEPDCMAVITIVTSAPPLTEGGHLVIARSLERALIDAGHRAGIVTTPSNRFGRQGPAYLANWLTDVGMTGTGERVDQVISLRFPSYAVRHPAHVCWLVHTMREYYDLWDQFSSRLSPQGRVKERVRRTLIRRADTYFFKHHVKKLFTISQAVSDRLARWNGVQGEVLHPPPPQRPYRCDGYGDYLFFASRLSPLKRADLVLRALAQPGGARRALRDRRRRARSGRRSSAWPATSASTAA